jgi:hypothetical protein
MAARGKEAAGQPRQGASTLDAAGGEEIVDDAVLSLPPPPRRVCMLASGAALRYGILRVRSAAPLGGAIEKPSASVGHSSRSHRAHAALRPRARLSTAPAPRLHRSRVAADARVEDRARSRGGGSGRRGGAGAAPPSRRPRRRRCARCRAHDARGGHGAARQLHARARAAVGARGRSGYHRCVRSLRGLRVRLPGVHWWCRWQ